MTEQDYAVATLAEAIHAHLCDWNPGEHGDRPGWVDNEKAAAILTPWVRSALLAALAAPAPTEPGLDAETLRLFGLTPREVRHAIAIADMYRPGWRRVSAERFAAHLRGGQG